VNIAGQIDASYTLSSGDVGHTIRVVVTAANAGGSTSATSGQVGVVTTASSGGAGCTVTVSSLSLVNADLTSGAVVCIAAGSYGSLALSASPASNATITAAPGAHVVVSGVMIGAKNLTVSQLHSTGGIEVNSGGGNDVITHNDVTDPHGYGISVLCSNGCSASDKISNITISGNEIHETNSTGEGDALRFDGWSNITVKENDIYNIRECASDTCHTDTLQSYQAGIATSGLTLERNYIHDCVDAQGFPFLKDGDVGNVTISDNLALRMSSKNEVTGMFIDDNSVGLSITNNTYQGTSGSVVQSEGSASNPTLAVNHNVFDTFNVPAGKYAVTEDYDIFTANNEWTFNLGPHSSNNSNPGFINTSIDDYRLASNPNHIGVDWSPATQQYGPIN
jgi:Right handed beta helix region